MSLDTEARSTSDLEAGCPSGLAPADASGHAADPAPFVRHSSAGAELELLVRGAKCAGCIKKIEGGVTALDGVETARLNLSTGKLRVTFDEDRLAPKAITTALDRLGYHAAPFEPQKALSADDAEGRRLLVCMAVAGFATANVMLLSVSVWAGHDGEMGAITRDLFHWISALIALPAAAFAGRPFFESAVTALRAGRANMDVPISLAVILALSMSVVQTLAGETHAYFDAAVMLLFFLLIGRWLDHALRRRARRAARDLLALQAATASRIGADGAVAAVAAGDIVVGDRLLLAPGDRSPVDAMVEEGVSDLDVSLATGESAPQTVHPGVPLSAGMINLTAPLTVCATARAADSFLADLARLMEAGEQAKTRYVRLADKAAALYVPLVHSTAALTFVGWLLLGGGFQTAALNAIALLIITCPCALGLAAPAVQVVATGRLFARGLLVKSGDALERLAEIDHVVFDKTGTLTLSTSRLLPPSDAAAARLEAAAQLARASRHPKARALAAYAGAGPVAAEAREVPGRGVEARIDGVPARLGSPAWLGVTPETEDGRAALWFALGDAAPVRFDVATTLRPDAAAMIKGLRARGLGVEMLTGDAPAEAARVAATLGLEDWRAEATPQDKIARLDVLAAEGRRVLMVGDGLNDAPALARAHASVSPGSALDVSQNAADVVLQGESLAPLVDLLAAAKTARRRVLQNFAFAALYNACAVPLAAAGLVTPLIAAAAMSGSSIVVTLNALRQGGGSRGARAIESRRRSAGGAAPVSAALRAGSVAAGRG